MKKVLVITKSTMSYGTGHLIRSKAIYNEIKKNYQAKLITNEDKKNYYKYDILVFDLPDYNNFLQKNYNYKNQKIVCIDYNGQDLIDLNFSSVRYSHKAKKNLVSINNIILNKPKKYTSIKKKFVLISMGGSDPKNYTKKILLKLLKDKGIIIKVILGKLNKNYNSFKNLKNDRVTILQNPKNFRALQANCKYAITNGGMTMCEMIYLNKKIFAVPKNKNEENFCKLINKKYNLKFGKVNDVKIINYKYKEKLKIGNDILLKTIRSFN
jgi:spore coat polysaccharide biosynthesis predicted glycosyltransferase SpsG